MKLDLCIYEALSYTSVPWKPHSWAWLSISTNINYANIWEYTVEGGADDGARYQTCYANSTKGCIHGSIWKGSIVLDRPSELWSLEAIQLLQTTPTWLVTCPWPNGSAVPLMSCTCTIHGFLSWRARHPQEKQSNQGYEHEHLGQADWLVSEQKAS